MVLLGLIKPFTSFSQISCGTPTPELDTTSIKKMLANEKKFTALNTFNRSTNITYIPIRVMVVRDQFGYANITNQKIINQIADLNSAFSSLGVQFYFLNNLIYSINDSNFNSFYPENTNLDYPIRNQDYYGNIYDSNNAINLYYVKDLLFTGQASGTLTTGIANFPSNVLYNTAKDTNRLFVIHSTTSYFLIHEMGHYFGLFHTFETLGGTSYENPSGTNCQIAGDLICDTNADPFERHNILTGGSAFNCFIRNIPIFSCSTGNGYAPPFYNHMSYYDFSFSSFTSQQYNRMAYYGNYRLSNDSQAPLNERYYLDGQNKIFVNYTSPSICFGEYDALGFEVFGELPVKNIILQLQDISGNLVYTSPSINVAVYNNRKGVLYFTLPNYLNSGYYRLRLLGSNQTIISPWSDLRKINGKIPRLVIDNRIITSGQIEKYKSAYSITLSPNITIQPGSVFEAKIDAGCY